MDISGLLTVPNIIVLAFVAIFSALDETSRTVTDGEYSFFNEIKDQRDREMVLRLAGEGETRNGEPREEDQPQPHAQAVAAGDPGLQEQDRA